MLTFSTDENHCQPHLSPLKSDVNDDAAAQPTKTFAGVVSAWEAAEVRGTEPRAPLYMQSWSCSPGILLLLLHVPTAVPFPSLSLNPPHLGLSHPYSPHSPLASLSVQRSQILLASALKLLPGWACVKPPNPGWKITTLQADAVPLDAVYSRESWLQTVWGILSFKYELCIGPSPTQLSSKYLCHLLQSSSINQTAASASNHKGRSFYIVKQCFKIAYDCCIKKNNKNKTYS